MTAVTNAGRGSLRPNGFTGGLQAGYNIQFGQAVLGFEVDVNYLGLRKSRSVTQTYPGAAFNFTINQDVKTDWLVTARPRLGIANGPWLAYVTGGLAVTELKYGNSFTDNTGQNPFESAPVSKVVLGWTAGAGLEHAVEGAWSWKAEYLYVSFEDINSNGRLTDNTGANAPFNHSADLSAHIVRVGVNKKL